MAEENEIDLENPAIKAAIATAVEASVSGLKTKNTELLGKLKDTTGKPAAWFMEERAPNLTQRMLKELSPSPMPATKD